MGFLVFLILFGHTLSFDANQYDHKQIMWEGFNDMGTKEDIYTIYWSLDMKTIKIALEVKTLGWIGFGIAEQSSGTMGGSDVFQGFVNSSGAVEFKDRYVLRQLPGTNSFQAPLTDKCQNWVLISGEETGGKTILEVSRSIDTQDPQDRPILLKGNTKIILAFGADDQDVWDIYHTRERRLATSLDFSGVPYNDPIDAVKNEQGIEVLEFFGWFNITTDKEFIRRQGDGYMLDDVTVYFYFYKNLNEILQHGDIHIIAIEDIIKDETKEFVHHFILDGVFYNYTSGASEDDFMLYGWAPGVSPMVSDQCGFKASKTTGINFLRLQTHYDNPMKKEGIVDTSGVRIYYTRELRAHDCSVVRFGQPNEVHEDPWLIPGKTKYVYECLDIGVDKNGTDIDWNGISEITVYSETLHMHSVGREMWSEIKRDGGEWITTSSIEFWDFNFQSFYKPLIGKYKLKKGDSLRITCIFETEIGKPTHKYGLASQDEMCIQFSQYYPRVKALDYLCHYTRIDAKATRAVESNVTMATDFGKPIENAICPIITDDDSPISTQTSGGITFFNPLHLVFPFFLTLV